MDSSPCQIDHTSITEGGFCTSCGQKILFKQKFCSNGHVMLPKLNFCTDCGEPPQVDWEVPAPRAINKHPMSGEFVTPQYFTSDGYLQPPIYAIQPSPGSRGAGISPGIIKGLVSGIGLVLIAVFVIVKVSNVPTTDVTVKMTLVGASCSDISWGFSDIPGGNVNLSVDGVSVGSASYDSYGITSSTGCQFGTTIYGVKENGSSYSVTSGNAIRGVVTENKAQLSSDNWTFNLTLGSN